MAIELKITGEDSGEVMKHVRDLAGVEMPQKEADFAEQVQDELNETPDPAGDEPDADEAEKKQPAKKSGGAKKSSGGSRQKGSGGSKKKKAEAEAEPEKSISFEDLTEAANKFIQAMSGEMRKAQDMVQEAFGVRKISLLSEDQYGEAYRWLIEQAEKAQSEEDDD